MRIPVDTGAYGEYLHYGAPLTLVTVRGKNDELDVSTNASLTPLPGDIPRLVIGILRVNYTNQLLAESGEFVVNVMTEDMRAIALQCGTTSGHDVDKFALCDLHTLPAQHVRAPIIAECPLHIECRVEDVLHLSDLDLWVAEILAMGVDEVWANGRAGINLARYRPLIYAFGHTFARGEQIGLGGL
ncbi:MAG: flavin reductase family protein [Chloroflexi bacterium]|nr:flavin reductase family protein [Chloroflexota bacterium]